MDELIKLAIAAGLGGFLREIIGRVVPTWDGKRAERSDVRDENEKLRAANERHIERIGKLQDDLAIARAAERIATEQRDTLRRAYSSLQGRFQRALYVLVQIRSGPRAAIDLQGDGDDKVMRFFAAEADVTDGEDPNC